ncbi:MAG: mechanosensitive ion channel family protein [Elainellaceae cyanobacterium]
MYQWGQPLSPFLNRSLKRAIVLGVVLLAALFIVATPAQGQDSDSSSFELPVISQLEDLELSPVETFLSPVGNYINSAPVRLDGRTIFRVAPTENLSAELRAREIEQRLQQFARRGFDPDTLTVDPDANNDANQPVIYLNNDYSVLTVTRPDAQLSGLSDPDIRAQELSQTIRDALFRYRQERRPGYLQRQAQFAGVILFLMVILSLAATIVQNRLRRKKRQIQKSEPVPPEVAPSSDPSSAQVVSALREKVAHQQKLKVLEFQRWLCKVAQGLIWGGGTLLILGLFPQTRRLQPFILDVLKIPLRVILAIVVTYTLVRLSNILVDRIILALQERAALASVRSQRLALRFSTFSQVIKSIVDAVLIAIGALTILSFLGLDLAPLLAGAGIIGLALSLASQNLLKDIINGFLILAEDQYGVGDVIVVGDVSGFVEIMNLRITQLRNEEGRLITIPNSEIKIVQNLSKEWSRVDLLIPVAPSADINAALALIKEIAEEMRTDPFWQELILEPPLLLGVDSLDYIGATVRIWIKTLPLKQWDVAREYRRRLKIAFDQSGINIGVPQQSLQLQSALPIVSVAQNKPSSNQSADSANVNSD